MVERLESCELDETLEAERDEEEIALERLLEFITLEVLLVTLLLRAELIEEELLEEEVLTLEEDVFALEDEGSAAAIKSAMVTSWPEI